MNITKLGKLTGDWSNPDKALIQRVNDLFSLTNSDIKLIVQKPNDVTLLTTDKLEHYNPDHSYTIKRYRIHLTDWQPGHFYCYNNEIHTGWSAGDVYTYEWAKTSYSSANASHNPCIVLELTGVLSENTTDFINRLKRFGTLQLELTENSW